jgi:hypothetical protein
LNSIRNSILDFDRPTPRQCREPPITHRGGSGRGRLNGMFDNPIALIDRGRALLDGTATKIEGLI